jgi:hypothetical protein
MKLSNFLSCYVDTNAVIKLWIKTKSGHEAKSDYIMAWEAVKSKEYGNFEFSKIISIMPESFCHSDTVNIEIIE